jgi:acetyltransferase-like isoleucine patch superfamily enzyme
MAAAYSLAVGAFTSISSGYFFGVKFGRYCSIEEAVQVGRGSHPPYWASTSPLFYSHHKNVFNQDISEAANFKPNAPPQHAKHTTIGNDVRIGHGALLSQGVTIGDGAIIQPFTVVTKDVAPYAIIAGNPGTITGMRFPARIIARMQELAWWRFAFWDIPGAPVAEPEAFLDHIEWCVKAGMKPYAPAPVVLSGIADKLQ